MDITKQLDQVIAQDDEGSEQIIYQKNGEPYVGIDGKPATITVVGTESKRVRAALDANDRRAIRGRRQQTTPEDMRENRVNVAVAGSIAWRGWDDGTQDIPCTPENLRKLYRADHILQQVEAAITRHADFFATSSKS
jgi:hypothetical protein